MIHQPIKFFCVLTLSSFIGIFIEIGDVKVLACNEDPQKLTLISFPNSEEIPEVIEEISAEKLLQKIRNLQAPISIKNAGGNRCGATSVEFIDAQGTEFKFGVNGSGLIFFTLDYLPEGENDFQLDADYDEAKTILLNLLKDWLQPNRQLQPNEHQYRHSLNLMVTKIEERDKKLSN